MDLIYANSSKEDIGVLKDYTFDLAFGSDENDFECTVSSANNVCKAGYYLYYEGSEYGGIIDSISVDTESESVTYKGRTWHGILESKVLCPDIGADYLTVSGEANTVIATLISRMNLTSIFKASSNASGINIPTYKMNRYISAYKGINKMLKFNGGKLNVAFKNGFVELSAKPLINYAEDEEFDADQISFTIQKNFNPINHVICLGQGDLKERRVIHVFADILGNISGTQTLTGIDEVCATYNNSNAESDDELKQGGIDMITEAWGSDSVEFNFESDEESFDISDIIGAREYTTGTVVSAYITKKIVNISNNTTSISYSCEASSGTVSGGSYPSSGSGGGGGASITVDDAMSTTSTNPVQNKVITEAINDTVSKSAPIISGTQLKSSQLTGCGNEQILSALQYNGKYRIWLGNPKLEMLNLEVNGNSYDVESLVTSLNGKPNTTTLTDNPKTTKVVNGYHAQYLADATYRYNATELYNALAGKVSTSDYASGSGTINTTYAGTVSSRSVAWQRFGKVVIVSLYDIKQTTSVVGDGSTSIIASGLPKAKYGATSVIMSHQNDGQSARIGIAAGSTNIIFWWTYKRTTLSNNLSGQLMYIAE